MCRRTGAPSSRDPCAWARGVGVALTTGAEAGCRREPAARSWDPQPSGRFLTGRGPRGWHVPEPRRPASLLALRYPRSAVPRLSSGPSPRRRISIAVLRAAAQLHGGRCLSPSYAGYTVTHRWRCSEGHVWSATPAKVCKARGTWCPFCAGRTRKTIGEMRAHAAMLSGQCLSAAYVNNQSPLRWRCKLGHEWEATAANIFPPNCTWCPTCAGRRKDIKDMQALASRHGGKCLSSRYVTNKVPLEWECDQRHRWWAVPSSIQAGTWCARCHSPPRGTIADMRALARTRRGECVSRRYVNDSTKLTWRCTHGHTWNAPPNAIKAGTWCPACAKIGRRGAIRRTYSIEDMKVLAAEQGGWCLSPEYLGMNAEHEWRCRAGHVWHTYAAVVRRGGWCRRCADEKRRAKPPVVDGQRVDRALGRAG